MTALKTVHIARAATSRARISAPRSHERDGLQTGQHDSCHESWSHVVLTDVEWLLLGLARDERFVGGKEAVERFLPTQAPCDPKARAAPILTFF